MVKGTSIKISRAIPGDARGIVEVSKITWLTTYPNKKLGITIRDLRQLPSFDLERIKRWRKNIKENKKRRSWVAKENKKIIGFCGASKETGINEIGAIYILPPYQGQGVGKKLIKKAFTWLGNGKDITVKVVRYNKQAIDFYKTVGFKKVGNVKKSKWHKLPSGKLLPEVMMIKKV
ncbi:MAG: GNAT family N-acetyltransferase [Candidatus Magasanikiibacteriota bacterium]